MKKIDLHIHTISVEGKDSSFQFSMDRLVEYAESLSLDAIAITNHNLFNLEQFEAIKEKLTNVLILPGIEIDFVGGHLLLIGDNDDLKDFSDKCDLVRGDFLKSENIDVDRLKEIFVDLQKYLLIPHYNKKPNISRDVIDSLNDFIFSGEVQSPKKFSRAIKDSDSLAPVLFSDIRISDSLNIEDHQGRLTFIKTGSEELSLDVIKASLRDKSKIFLSDIGNHDFFQIFNDGQNLSNGLNIVLGQRSSGKTVLLDRLKKIFDKNGKDVKYIEQFSLVNGDEKKFNEMLEREKSAVRENHLKEFRVVVEDIVSIDWVDINYKMSKYVETLIEFAFSEKLRDEFSKSVMFTELIFQLQDNKNLEKLIKSVIMLVDEKTHKTTINKYVPVDNLNRLLADLEITYKTLLVIDLKKSWVNELMKNIKSELEKNTSSPQIQYNDDINFYEIKTKKEKIKRFNLIANSLKHENIINEDESFGKFKIQAVATKYNGAGELHDESGRQIPFTNAFKKYDSPYIFLRELKNITGLEKAELYKYFCKVNYKVLNEYNKKISGGKDQSLIC